MTSEASTITEQIHNAKNQLDRYPFDDESPSYLQSFPTRRGSGYGYIRISSMAVFWYRISLNQF